MADEITRVIMANLTTHRKSSPLSGVSGRELRQQESKLLTDILYGDISVKDIVDKSDGYHYKKAEPYVSEITLDELAEIK